MCKSVIKAILILALFLHTTTPTAFADLFLNEFSSSTSEDWIEIYNSGEASIDLSEYRIRDDTATNKLDLSGSIGSQEFKVFMFSNKLNNSGDIIKLLLKNDESIIKDQVAYGDKGNDVPSPVGDQSAGRQSNGNSRWVIFASSSNTTSNISSSIAPTSTPAPQPTQTPTKAPTSTKAPTPVKSSPTQPKSISTTVTGLPTVKAAAGSKSNITTRSKSISSVPTSILGINTRPTSKPTGKNPNKDVLVNSASKNNIRYLALAMGLIALSCAILVFLKIKRNNQV